jgi:3-methyladenine DNA glycosylase AlkD
MQNIIETIRAELIQRANEKTRISGQRFFKEDIDAYGVKIPEVQQIGKTYFREIRTASKAEIFSLCEMLWQSGKFEECIIACNWSHAVHKQYEPGDFHTFEHWIEHYVTNWATCDTFCNHTMGAFLEMYPEYLSQLRRLAVSTNRWLRRAAAVSLIIPARKGMYLQEIFGIANLLLTDPDDLVRKGYGWMLKVAASKHLSEVFNFVMQHRDIMPRVALRYAIEKMPPEMKAEAMKMKNEE